MEWKKYSDDVYIVIKLYMSFWHTRRNQSSWHAAHTNDLSMHTGIKLSYIYNNLEVQNISFWKQVYD